MYRVYIDRGSTSSLCGSVCLYGSLYFTWIAQFLYPLICDKAPRACNDLRKYGVMSSARESLILGGGAVKH